MKILNYNQYVNMINEKLITFGGKAYPKFGQIVIVCGGGGSGKGFVVSNVLGIEAKILNVDDVKETLIKMKDTDKLSKLFKEKYGKFLSQVDMANEEDVNNLHIFVEDHNLAVNTNNTFFKEQAKKKDKANALFDVTLKRYPKLPDIVELAVIGGYDPKNIHLVWVLNNFDMAKKQNSERSRRVAEDILKSTHVGCAKTVQDILKNADEKVIIDGDIWIYFANREVDSKLAVSDAGGKYLEDFVCVKIKEQGKKIEDYETVMNKDVKVFDSNGKKVETVKLRDKINDYVPVEVPRF